jgi:hypothetical protein
MKSTLTGLQVIVTVSLMAALWISSHVAAGSLVNSKTELLPKTTALAIWINWTAILWVALMINWFGAKTVLTFLL